MKDADIVMENMARNVKAMEIKEKRERIKNPWNKSTLFPDLNN